MCTCVCTSKGQLVPVFITLQLILLDRVSPRTLSSPIQQDQLARTLLSSPPQCWDYMHIPPHPVFYGGARDPNSGSLGSTLALYPLKHLPRSRYSSRLTHFYYGVAISLSTTHKPICCALCRHSMKSHDALLAL